MHPCIPVPAPAHDDFLSPEEVNALTTEALLHTTGTNPQSCWVQLDTLGRQAIDRRKGHAPWSKTAYALYELAYRIQEVTRRRTLPSDSAQCYLIDTARLVSLYGAPALSTEQFVDQINAWCATWNDRASITPYDPHLHDLDPTPFESPQTRRRLQQKLGAFQDARLRPSLLETWQSFLDMRQLPRTTKEFRITYDLVLGLGTLCGILHDPAHPELLAEVMTDSRFYHTCTCVLPTFFPINCPLKEDAPQHFFAHLMAQTT